MLRKIIQFKKSLIFRIRRFPRWLIYIVIGLFVYIFVGFFALLLEITRLDQAVNRSDLGLCPTFKFVDHLPKILDIFYLPLFFVKSDLPQYRLVVDTKDLNDVYKDVPACFDCNGTPTNKEIPAKFYAEGKEYKVDIGLRGLCGDHWIHPKKSWKILFDKDNPFKGNDRIDLVPPISRGILTTELSAFRSRKLGLVTPESEFVNLVINNRDYGVYWEKEDLGKEVLEKNEQNSDVNLYRDDINLARDDDPVGLLYKNVSYWNKKAINPADIVDNYAELDALLNLVNNSSDEEFNNELPLIIDMENFYKWHIHEKLFGSYHQTYRNNAAIYFDRTLGKFKFIPDDAGIEPTRFNFFTLFSRLPADIAQDKNYNPLVTRVLLNPQFVKERNKILWEYVKDDKYLSEEKKFYNNLYNKTKGAFYRDNKKTYSNIYFDLYTSQVFKKIEENFNLIRELLKSEGNISTKITFPAISNADYLIFDFYTNNFSGIKLKQIEFELKEGTSINSRLCIYMDSNEEGIMDPLDKEIICNNVQSKGNKAVIDNINIEFFPDRKATDPTPIIKNLIPEFPNIEVIGTYKKIFVTFDNSEFPNSILDVKIDASNALTDDSVSIRETIADLRNLSRLSEIDLNADAFIEKNKQFIKEGNNTVILRGAHKFYDSVIVPKNLLLKIESSTRLEFANKVSLISYSPVEARGSKDNPIIFTSINTSEPWGVFGIVNTGNRESIFEYTTFENGGESNINGLYFTGQFSAFFSKVRIENSTFRFANGDDGANIKNSDSLVDNSYFYKNKFDALDLDFNNTSVLNSLFEDNGNDGIDNSSGKPYLYGNVIINSGDKGISCGEGTSAIIVNNLIRNSNIGIAIKDLSDVHIINTTLLNNNIGIAMYEKKEVFGGGVGGVANSIIWQNKKQFEIDSKSTLNINSSIVEGGYAGDQIQDEDPEINSDFIPQKINIKANNGVLNEFCKNCKANNNPPIGFFINEQ